MRIEKIVINGTDLKCGPFRMLGNVTTFGSNRVYDTLTSADYSRHIDTKEFQPQAISFESMQPTSLDTLKKIAEIDKEMLLEVHYSGIVKSAFVKLSAHSYRQLYSTKFGYMKLDLIQESFWFKLESYVIDNTGEAGSGSGWPWKWPHVWGAASGSYDSSVLNIVNTGITDAPFEVSIVDEAVRPSFGVNDFAEDTYKSFESTLTLVAGDRLTVNSFTPTLAITLNGVDVAGDRVFDNSKAYNSLPVGNSQLRFRRVNKALITVYILTDNLYD